MSADPGDNFGPDAYEGAPWFTAIEDDGTSSDPADNFGPDAWDEFNPGIPATGATAGIPGSFTPAGAEAPETLAALQGGGVTASPATAWTVGQHVVLGDLSKAYWNATAWVAGQAAAAVVTEANTKAEIVEWLLDHGVELSESALMALTKAELLELVADLLDTEPEGG
jgi:hypothetical protein